MSGLLDSGGAEMVHRRETTTRPLDWARLSPRPKSPPAEAIVTFSVAETHDGAECDCIATEAKTMMLRVGESIVLTHTCHDGRVDKITATIEAIETPRQPVEHGSVSRA